MSARTFVAAGLCAVLVPLVSALPPALPDSFTPIVLEAGAVVPQAAAAPELPVRSTRIERRDAGAGLEAAVAAIQRADSGPLWIGWTVPAVASREGHGNRWNDGDIGRCVLDDDGDIRNSHGINGGTRHLVILVRSQGVDVDAGRVHGRTLHGRCRKPAGVLGVGRRAVSKRRVTGSACPQWRVGPNRGQQAAAARTGSSRARAACRRCGRQGADRIVAPGQVRDLRRDAAFWMGAARGEAGAAVVERLARDDADDDFREHLTFVLTLIGDRGIDTLITLAKRDASSKVRGQALFWLGQKAGQRAVATLEGAIVDDPDREVRKKAVFSLSQLPKDEGVPKLIAVARTHRDPEVRKQAMFWLGQSGDERAVRFFEDVLKN